MKRIAMLLVVLVACREQVRKDPGAPPAADHQAAIRALHDQVLGGRYQMSEPSTFRFSPPQPGRVAGWHWEPQEDGRSHAFGYRHGWCVEFDVTPHYAGYPPQPEAHRMAFFGDGKLRGLFSRGGNSAPLELDAWSPLWVDPGWREVAGPNASPR